MMTDLDQTVDRILIQIKAADNSAQYLYARRLYDHQDIRWNYRYRDITSFSEHGTMVIDYTAFHEIMPQ